MKAKLKGEWTITVCDVCLCASCWQGEFFCQDAKFASTKEITIREARKLKREHSDYWRNDLIAQQKIVA